LVERSKKGSRDPKPQAPPESSGHVRWQVALLVALLLAGCSSSSSSPGVFSASNYTPLEFQQPQTYNATLASGSFDVGPTSAFAQPFPIPNGTVRANLTLTFVSGGSADGLVAHLATCTLRFPGPIAATGQSLTLDCGGVPAGDTALRFDAPSGQVQGTFVVRAEVCKATPRGASCPKAAPVGSP